MSPPLFAEQRSQQAQQQVPVYSWASVEAITKAASSAPPPVQPTVPTTYEDAYTESADPDDSSFGGQMQYVYFEMPQTAMPGYPSAASSTGNERTPLMAASPSAPSAPAGDAYATTSSAAPAGAGGFPGNMFAAPCAYSDIPPDN